MTREITVLNQIVCGPDDIIIKTEGCGICAGDLKCFHGNSTWGDATHKKWVRPPFIPGHEFLGHVVAKGEHVTEYEIGDRIIAEQIVPCGKCRFGAAVSVRQANIGCASLMLHLVFKRRIMVVWLNTYVTPKMPGCTRYPKI